MGKHMRGARTNVIIMLNQILKFVLFIVLLLDKSSVSVFSRRFPSFESVR
jgi:hypothetical protein